MKPKADLKKVSDDCLVTNGYYIYDAYEAALSNGQSVEPESFAEFYLERCFPSHSQRSRAIMYKTFIQRLSDKK